MSVTEEMNGSPATQADAQQKPSAPVVKMLEDLLTSARKGEIVSLGVVVVGGPGKYMSMGVLTGLLELSAGADDLKDTIKNAIRALAAPQQQRSTILRPAPGFDPQRMG